MDPISSVYVYEWGLFPYTNKQFLNNQLGVLQFDLIVTLATWR